MPLQNRVTPLGAIERHPARGLLTGNLGCLHDRERRVVRDYQVRRWIICVLEFKGRRAELMRPGHYTHLFFLDEATALAAGHRPCAECQRERFVAFRERWAAANPELAGDPRPLVATIDDALHRERVAGARKAATRKVSYAAPLAGLPDGVMILLPGQVAPHLVLGDRVLPWSFAGYGEPIPRPAGTLPVTVLTPRSTVGALAHGYVPLLHPSAGRRPETR